MVLRRITKRQMAVISQDSKAEWAGIDPQDESRTCQVRGWIFFFFLKETKVAKLVVSAI